MDLRDPYLTEQLIAYIGNKRALLPFLHGAFARLAFDGGDSRRTAVSFIDPFAGSGAVSRLARLLGFRVVANDWEPYSFIINSCHLGIAKSELPVLFRARGGCAAVLDELNRLPPPAEAERYIARHYAPRSTAGADWRTERLFYTTENALAIDAIRSRIEQLYPGTPADPAEVKEKAALLAALLYQAATHTNTSGVFKACHRGFGGHGKDALGRIMGPIRLAPPVLADCGSPSEVFQEDALRFLSGRGADICYLDPPYAVHQYGSNYFMLNTIALWDRPPVSEERGADGRLLRKAGIRQDWTRTRSAFCYQSTALAAMREVVLAADCNYLAVSYSDEGLIGLEELCEILSGTGALAIQSTGYVKYPGGKQSLGRKTRNMELLLVVDRRARGGRMASAPSVAAQLLDVRLARLLGSSFHPARVRAAFAVEGDDIVFPLSGGESVRIPTRGLYRFLSRGIPEALAATADRERFERLLAPCETADASEEIDILLDLAVAERDQRERDRLLKQILLLFNRIAHRKYDDIFRETLERLRRFAGDDPRHASFRQGLDRVAQRAERRRRPGSGR